MFRSPLLALGGAAAHALASQNRVGSAQCREQSFFEKFKKRPANMDLRVMQERAKMREFTQDHDASARECELDMARVGVDIALLKKICKRQEREGENKDAEIRKLQAQLRSGEDRFKKLLSHGKSRPAEIAWSLMQASPSMAALSAKQIAHAINDFEDFSNPDKLKATITDTALDVHFGDGKTTSWYVHYTTFKGLVKSEQGMLKSAVDEEILKQKELFPSRRLVQQACEEHLSKCLLHGNGGQPMSASQLWQHMEELTERERLKECDRFSRDICDKIASIFKDLEKQFLDVDAVLLSNWQPLLLQHTLWAFGYLQKIKAAGLQASQEVPAEERQQLGTMMYDLYKQSVFTCGFSQEVE